MRHETRDYEFVVVGGGMAGIAAAVSAARRGVRTALVQDRPVLGGNGSKEIRIGLHGAEGGENHRYFRETGLMEELRLENLHRNPLGNAELWDALLLETVATQENLELFLNTTVIEVNLALELPRPGAQDPQPRIASVEAVTLASERRWTFQAPLFADCTGDGMVAFLAGADFRTGREARHEFQESLAPEKAAPHTLGSVILFALKDAGRPVPYVAPKWAHRFSEPALQLWRHGSPNAGTECWRIDWGGELDTIHDNEQIRVELLRIVHGMFDHLKNSSARAAELANYTLEWIGSIPGKRESRRIIGDYILTQHDVLDQPDHEDAVAVGGASIDCTPPQDSFAGESALPELQLPGMYNIPLRSLYTLDVGNLFLAGRSISATHVALCSTRAMLTGGQMGEAVGTAAAHCVQRECPPAALLEDGGVYTLQQDLLLHDHPILGLRAEDPLDRARSAEITESSVAEASLDERAGEVALDEARALMVPLAGKLDCISMDVRAEEAGTVRYILHGPNPKGNFIPGPVLREGTVELLPSTAPAWVDFPIDLDDAEPGFYWLVLSPARGVSVSTTQERLVGVLTYAHEPGWEPDPGPWRLDRHPRNPFSPWRKCDFNLCFRTDAWLPAFYAGEQVANGFSRPYRTPNIWVSAKTDFAEPEWLEFRWEAPEEISSIYLFFNTDLDRDLRNLWHEYDERAIPECGREYRLLAWTGERWEPLVAETDNHQRWRKHTFPTVSTTKIRLEIRATHGDPRAQVYEVRLYGPEGPWYSAG